MEKLAKIATEKGYSPEFVAFAQKGENPWNEDSAIEAVQAGKTEREVIEIILCPLTEGVFFSQKEREEYIIKRCKSYGLASVTLLEYVGD